MPKETASLFFKRMVKSYPDLSTDENILFCKCCEVKIEATKVFQIKQHLSTAKHTAAKKIKDKKNQTLLASSFVASSSTTQKFTQFNLDLCEALVRANIPIFKIDHKDIKTFLEKYTGHLIPDESTLRKKYMPQLYADVLVRNCILWRFHIKLKWVNSCSPIKLI